MKVKKVKVFKVFKPTKRAELPFVLYPMIAYHLKLSFKRAFMSEKVMNYFAYVDCIRAGIERGECILPTEEWEVDESLAMKERIEEREARKIAIKAAESWGNLMVISWWKPKVEVVKEVKAYKVFWIDGKTVIDSLTGEVFRV